MRVLFVNIHKSFTSRATSWRLKFNFFPFDLWPRVYYICYLTTIALIVKSCEHEEFVVLLYALIGDRSLKNCFLGLAIVSVLFT